MFWIGCWAGTLKVRFAHIVRRLDAATEARSRALTRFARAQGARAWVLDLRDDAAAATATSRHAGHIRFHSVRSAADGRRTKRQADRTRCAPSVQASVPRPLAVLVNGNTASAAEITARCHPGYRSRDRWSGRRRTAKDSCNRSFRYPDGSALKLTVERYLDRARPRSGPARHRTRHRVGAAGRRGQRRPGQRPATCACARTPAGPAYARHAAGNHAIRTMRIFMATGEASGDTRAPLPSPARCASPFDPTLEFTGIGSERMRAAGFRTDRRHARLGEHGADRSADAKKFRRS